VEIRIGIQNVSREIVMETDLTADAAAKAVEKALAGSVLDLTDDKGRRVVVPAAAIGYVELGEESKRRVGFGG
jgi:DNA-binding transcriptional regulator/RsmH inhibitor MraZ